MVVMHFVMIELCDVMVVVVVMVVVMVHVVMMLDIVSGRMYRWWGC